MRSHRATAVALFVAVISPAFGQVTNVISSSMDIYQAGGYNDGTGALPPVDYLLPPSTRTITFPSITGQWTCQSNLPYYTADGTTLPGNCLSGGREVGASGETLSTYEATDFAGAVAGVFLQDGPPVNQPSALRFFVSDSASGGIQTDFMTLSPQVGQVFFIGDGKTATGAGGVQTFFVPQSATHLYLGYADACTGSPAPGCFGDNAGSISVTLSAQPLLGLCNTGQTSSGLRGCSGELVPPNPPGGGTNRDGNWEVGRASSSPIPCLQQFAPAWVDTPNPAWLPNPVSTSSEWVTVEGGEIEAAPGWYVYRERFPIPSLLPGGSANPVLTVNGQLSSDNAVISIYLESPAGSAACSVVSNQPFPVNPPVNSGRPDAEEWWPFSFTNASLLMSGTDAFIYFVVKNPPRAGSSLPSSPTGFRVEFFASSFE